MILESGFWFLGFWYFLILEFGCLILGREINFCKWLLQGSICPTPKEKREKQKTEKKNNKKEQEHCLQGANPVLPQEEGPIHGTLANYFFLPFGT